MRGRARSLQCRCALSLLAFRTRTFTRMACMFCHEVRGTDIAVLIHESSWCRGVVLKHHMAVFIA